MENYIAAGFQNTVDFELEWDEVRLEALIQKHGISPAELRPVCPIGSERELLMVLLWHMAQGSGGECPVVSSEITRSFAAQFIQKITLGGTAVRAAMAIEKIGYRSTIHACSLNRHFRRLIPPGVHWLASVPDEGEAFHPHVILQYPKGAHLKVGGSDLVSIRPNRVIFAHDPPSAKLEIDSAFAQVVSQANVFLAASFNTIADEGMLADRLQRTISILRALPEERVVLMEDACFQQPHMGQLVVDTLSPYLDLFSLNEDELQDRAGERIDILDPDQVAAALERVYGQLKVPTLICHSAYWALAYGEGAHVLADALAGGICMAATRFRLGDAYGPAEYEETGALPPRGEGVRFCRALTERMGARRLLCLPGKDLEQVKRPVTIGLGDAFIGGMLPTLLPPQVRGCARI